MDVPSMVQRSGDTLIVRSVVSGNQLYFDKENGSKSSENLELLQLNQNVLSSTLECFEQSVLFDDGVTGQNNYKLSSAHQIEHDENQLDIKDEGLPQCKIKRNYSCSTCTFFTQNPRYFLTHLRDKHGEKIVINECKLCLYASRHYQKLVRHMKMVHGSTDGIEENGIARKRQLTRDNRKRKIENQSLVTLSNAQTKSLEICTENKRQITQAAQDAQQSSCKPQNIENFPDDSSKNRLKCSLCEFTTFHRSQLIVHENEEHCNAKFFRCEKCSYVTHIKARFSKHVKYHSMPMIKCFTCDFRTPYKWNLDRHMKNHGGTGTFKCAACNFTADIKQSLTVHEMNHHIPPVGNAAGMTNMRRKNKVGGTDISDEMLSELGDIEEDSNSINITCNNTDNENCNNDNYKNSNTNFTYINSSIWGDHNNKRKEYNNNNEKNCSNNNISNTLYDNINNNKNNSNNVVNYNNDNNSNVSQNNKKNNVSDDKFNKNMNLENCKNVKNSFDHKGDKINGGNYKRKPNEKYEQFGVIANENNNNIKKDIDLNAKCIVGKVEIDTKQDKNILEFESFSTKKFKYSLKDLPTDLSQKSALLDIMKPNFCSNNKSTRPIPNLIPIQASVLQTKPLNLYDDSQFQGEMHNLRQIAAMLFGKDIPQELLLHLPLLSPLSDSNHSGGAGSINSANYFIHKKSDNFFNKLKQRFNEDENNTAELDNLTCTCGYVCKCLSELYIHRHSCQNATYAIEKNKNIDCKKHSNVSPINLSINSASTRCQFCRHRCKSSTDLMNHLKNCSETSNQNDFSDSSIDTIEQNEDSEKSLMNKHPMENKVFIWNDISNSNKTSEETEAKNTILKDIDKKENLNKIDLSYVFTNYGEDEKTDGISYYGVETAPGYGEVTKKISSEEDSANASLKKVYKCPHCSFWASTASRFHVHIVGHLNKKPFECSLCSYRSNWRWDITKHIRLKTIRDPSHKNARVLMNDETGRRNYTKYNKYITLMKVTDEDGDPKLMKSGEMTPNQEASLSFIKDYENRSGNVISEMENISLALPCNDFNNEKKENFQLSSVKNNLVTEQYANLMPSEHNKEEINKCRSPDLIKHANISTYKICEEELVLNKNVENCSEKNKLYRCKVCNYKHSNRDMLVTHVKHHTSPNFSNSEKNLSSSLQIKVNSNYANLMNDMLAIIFKHQESENDVPEEHILQQAQTFAALNLNLVTATALKKKQEKNDGNSCNTTQNEHGEMDEASFVGVVTTTATTPTNDTSFSPNATASTNHLLNKNTQYVSNNKNNNDICNKNINVANTISTSNVMANGNSTSGSSNTSVVGGIISGSNSSKNSITNTHSAVEQNINHYNFNNILNHSNNMGNNGSNSHNNTDQWRGPAPYRCGHCHQVSNWKHVIQRHCRLKHNGDIRIETIDRLSDKISPVYRTLDSNSNQQSLRKTSQNIKIIDQLSSHQQIIGNTSKINAGTNNISNSSYTESNNVSKNEKVITPEQSELQTQVLNLNGNSSKSRQQFCPQCPYVSESKSQMNYHISLHKAKQYECKICRLLFNKKQQLFIHTKHTHDDQQQSIIENILTTNIKNISNLNNNVLSNSNIIENSDDENEDDEEEGKLVIDLISSYENNSITSNATQNLLFCQDCPTRYLSEREFHEHLKYHKLDLNKNEKQNYKCDFCSFKAKQEYSLLTHFSVHRQGYQDRTEILLKKFKEDKEHSRPILEKIMGTWVVKKESIPKAENSLINSIGEADSLSKTQHQENSMLLEETYKSANNSGKNFTKHIEQIILADKEMPMQNEKCSHCPFETHSSDIYKNHLKHHYTLSKIKSRYLCPHCDFSCSEEHILKSHVQVHFNFLNNNKMVTFFTSYNNLELNLNTDLNNTNGHPENISNDLVLYKSLDVNNDNTGMENNVSLPSSSENIHNKNENHKNVIDIKTGQILAVEPN